MQSAVKLTFSILKRMSGFNLFWIVIYQESDIIVRHITYLPSRLIEKLICDELWKNLLTCGISTLEGAGSKISIKSNSYSRATYCRILLSIASTQTELYLSLESNSYKTNVSTIVGVKLASLWAAT